ncbi:MAG: Crp/Fnr family transcriptional regulator [Cryomorphaceae bacterium]|nr:cyclic nucleotide-binding domain-containing protein [Flavobacteriales bacterium]
MNTTIEKVNFLQNVELFAEFPTEQLSYLAAIAEIESYDSGEELFAIGDPSGHLFMIISGEIEMVRKGKVSQTLTKNAAVGVLGFFDREPRLFNAVCKSPCQVLVIDADDFFDLLEDKVYITVHLLRYFVAQLRSFYNEQNPEKLQ